MTRAEIMKLPPVISLAELARALDVSEPTVRAAHRRDELAAMGIKVNRLGNRWLVVTSSVWQFLGLADGASPVPSPRDDAGQRGPASHGVRFLAPVRAAGD